MTVEEAIAYSRRLEAIAEKLRQVLEAAEVWAIEAHDFAEEGKPPDPGFLCNMCGGCGETRRLDHADTCPMTMVRGVLRGDP